MDATEKARLLARLAAAPPPPDRDAKPTRPEPEWDDYDDED